MLGRHITSGFGRAPGIFRSAPTVSDPVFVAGDMETRAMRAEDWPAVKAIYEQGIATRLATFETEAPEWEAWDAGHLAEPRLVAERDGEVLGWAALSPVSRRRPCYAGVVEESVYVAEQARGQGIGIALLGRICADAEAAGIWTIQTSIFPENVASIELHRRCGFRIVGTRERIAQLDGEWRDTVLMERRADA
jgi:L-amino acid N-acyltransferase YncA